MVTLSVALDGLVTRMARLQRVSKSQVLRELLEAAEPALQRAATLMEEASKATRKVHEQLAVQLDQDQDQAEAQMAKLFAFTRDLVDQAEAIRGRRPAREVRAEPGPTAPAGGRAGNPPTSNRGVRLSRTAPSKGLKRASR
jgi:esterase/lipase